MPSLLEDLAKAKEVYLVKANEISLDPVSFNSVLHACARLSQVAEAERTMRSMAKMRAMPTQVSYNAVINAHCQAGTIECLPISAVTGFDSC